MKATAFFLVACAAISFTGCASLDTKTGNLMDEQMLTAKATLQARGGLTVISNRPYVDARVVDFEPALAGGGIDVSAKGVAFADVIAPIAGNLGWNVQLLQGVDAKRPVALNLKGVEPASAIRQIAFSAGYVAIADPKERVFRIADEATVTFRVPPLAMAPVSPRLSMDFLSTPNASGLNASGSSGSQGSANTSLNASIRAAGGATPLDAYLKSLLGAGATVTIMQDAGTISVRGKGYQLKRATDFLEKYVAESTRRINVEVVIAEVRLTKDFEFGIDWAHVASFDRGTTAINIANAAGVASPSLTVNTTTKNITSVLKALETRTQVRVLSSPSLLLSNNAPGQWSKFTSRPYVPSVTTTPIATSPTTGSVSSTASLAEAPEGTTLTAIANIVDSTKAWVTLLAQSNDVVGQQIFTPTRDVTLTALVQSRTQMPVSVMAEHGKTIVIGGMRNSREGKSAKGVPLAGDIPLVRELLSNVNDLAANSEIVVLLHVTLQPSPRVDVVIGESI
jgi:type II secretory pathway component GspD/PulD (secretin)